VGRSATIDLRRVICGLPDEPSNPPGRVATVEFRVQRLTRGGRDQLRLAFQRLKDTTKFKCRCATQEAEQLLFSTARKQVVGRMTRRLLTSAVLFRRRARSNGLGAARLAAVSAPRA